MRSLSIDLGIALTEHVNVDGNTFLVDGIGPCVAAIATHHRNISIPLLLMLSAIFLMSAQPLEVPCTEISSIRIPESLV